MGEVENKLSISEMLLGETELVRPSDIGEMTISGLTEKPNKKNHSMK